MSTEERDGTAPMIMSGTNKKIKVMFIIDFIFALTGGTENQVTKILTNIDRDKFEVSLLCLHETPWIREHGASLKCSVKAFKYNVFSHKDPRNIVAMRNIFRQIRAMQPDVVVVLFKTSYIVGVLLSRLAGVRNIISTRRDFGLWLDKKSVFLLRLANRFVRRIITNAHAIKDLVIKEEGFDPAGIDVVYNGIDIKEFQKDEDASSRLKEMIGIPLKSPVVGIVAGLRPMKRHETFLKAARNIQKRRDDVHFVIVGDGPLRRALEEDAARLEIMKKVHFIGWQKDVRSVLSIFDIGVNCSANEGLSNAIMEYMASGVPCVVSRAGGNQELVEHEVNGYTFELEDDERLAELIIDLLTDAKKRHEFMERSQERIRTKYGIPEMVRAYEKHFVEVLGTNHEQSGLTCNA